jgi:hypothetical protein
MIRVCESDVLRLQTEACGAVKLAVFCFSKQIIMLLTLALSMFENFWMSLDFGVNCREIGFQKRKETGVRLAICDSVVSAMLAIGSC